MTAFISRWSRLKRGADQQPATPLVVSPKAAVAAEEADFDLSLLPSLQEITAETDISSFLRKAVPQELRQAALKRIWALDPAIRDFVGPVDYAWDFNAPGGLPGITEAFTGDASELLARAIGAVSTEAPDNTSLSNSDDGSRLGPVMVAAEHSSGRDPEPAIQPAQQVIVMTAAPTPTETAVTLRRHGSATPC